MLLAKNPPASSYELCYHPKDGIKTLTEKMHKNKTITHLNLRGNALNLNHGAADFLEMMISNKTITNLNYRWFRGLFWCHQGHQAAPIFVVDWSEYRTTYS